MPLATKNNAIIVKDGKVAENCACCGGWYCCPDAKCIGDTIQSVSVALGGSDSFQLYALRQTQPSLPFQQWPVIYYDTYGVFGSKLTGSFTLSKTSRVVTAQSASWIRYTTQFSYAFPPQAGGCADSLLLTVVDGGYYGDANSGTFGQIGISSWTLTLSCNAIWKRRTSPGMASAADLACDSVRGTRVVSRSWGGSFRQCMESLQVNSPTFGQPPGYAGGLPQRVFFSDEGYSITTIYDDLQANPGTQYWLDDTVGLGDVTLVSLVPSLS